MNTPSFSKCACGRQETQSAGSRRGAGRISPSTFRVLLLVSCLLPLASSCGHTQGALLFLLGFGRGALVEPKFQLTQGPVMILIDDAAQRVDWPPATRHLFGELAQELLTHKAATKIIPAETIGRLRQLDPNFEKKGCREIGELGGAEQVLWIEVQSFYANEQIQEVNAAAYFTATVKVINALEKERRSRVRLWPTSPQGHLVTVTLTGSEVSLAKTKDAIAKKLAGKLATAIAKLFYQYRLGDFEREP